MCFDSHQAALAASQVHTAFIKLTAPLSYFRKTLGSLGTVATARLFDAGRYDDRCAAQLANRRIHHGPLGAELGSVLRSTYYTIMLDSDHFPTYGSIISFATG